jgi:hypothetical protein
MQDTVLGQFERTLGGPLVAVAALAIAIILLIALVVLASRYMRLAHEFTAERQRAAGAIGGPPPESPGELMRTSVDRVLMRNPVAFYLLVTVIAAGTWLLGWAIAPSTSRFLASREWHIQPFYLAVHLIALRLFVSLFVRRYVAGAAQLDIPADQIAQGIRRILGPPGALAAVLIAAPLCALDFRYLLSEEYERLSEDQALHAIDYLMWGIWCTEWLLNAMIWVTLAGFLAMSYRALRTFRFRAPITTVVQEKLYRPFLQMSSQGATIVLGFACVTGLYIWYAEGAPSDFIGLAITGVLLVAGFVPSWLLLNAKVKRTVRDEIEALRRGVSAPVAASMLAGAAAGTAAAEGAARSVDERLDEVLALMRAWHLERLQLDLGKTEAQALAVRLAAPAATAGWQFYNNLQNILGTVGRAAGSIFQSLGGLFM